MRFLAWFAAMVLSFAFYFWALDGNLEGRVHPFVVYAMVVIPLFCIVGWIYAGYLDLGIAQDASDNRKGRRR